MNAAELVIGVDGGGTKTIAWLASPDHRSAPTILGTGSAGPSNMRAVGQAKALSNLDHAIAAAFGDAGMDRKSIAGACLALAGADRDQERTVFRDWAEYGRLAQHVQITNDALPVLFAGTPDGHGIALISGTGSLAFGRTATGATARSGGWGHLIGDEGSGYWIAIAGLKAAARFADGRGPQTGLLDLYLKHFDVSRPSELIPLIYTERFDRPAIAGLVALVFQANSEHDQPASEILEAAAGELAKLVTTVTERLHLSAPIPLALTGGILINQELMRELLPSSLAAMGGDTYSMTTVPNPVLGAVRMAADRSLR